MKKILLSVALLIMLSATLSFAETKTKPLDQIVAVVNDDVVTTSELNQALELVKQQSAQQNMAMPAMKVLEKQVLDQLINKKLQLQMAKQAGIKITDKELNKAISNVASQNHLSLENLYEQINLQGMSTKAYRNEIRDQLTLRKLQQYEVVNRVQVSQQEIKSYMNSKLWNNHTDKEYQLEDVLIPLPDAPTPVMLTAAKKQAEIILNDLTHGKTIKEVANTTFNGEKIQTGDLGLRKLPEIPSAFAEHIASMRVHGFAGPIQTPNGFHVIRLAAIKTLGAKAANINRKEAEELLMQRKYEEAIKNWVSKIRSQAYIVTNMTS